MHGLGRFYFFGSMIGHWDLPEGFTATEAEAVNMGIAPIVPAYKIKEILLQPEIVNMMKKVDAGIAAGKRKGAVPDFAGAERDIFTKEKFEAALKKATRKIEPAKR